MMAFEPIRQSQRLRTLTVKTHVSPATASGRFDNDRVGRGTRFSESMIAEKLSVFSPPFV
jgi:hypothetical protein